MRLAALCMWAAIIFSMLAITISAYDTGYQAGANPSPIVTPEPTGEIDVPLTSEPWECGIPEGCASLPATDADH